MPDTSVFPTLAEVVVFHHALGLTGVVFVGFSLGVLPAQSLAQTRPGARGAVLCYSALALGQWGDNWPARWPDGVRLQLHILEGDEDGEIAKVLAATVDGADLFLYPGTEHYLRGARRPGGRAAHAARARLSRYSVVVSAFRRARPGAFGATRQVRSRVRANQARPCHSSDGRYSASGSSTSRIALRLAPGAGTKRKRRGRCAGAMTRRWMCGSRPSYEGG
jgi:hypothetical protein